MNTISRVFILIFFRGLIFILSPFTISAQNLYPNLHDQSGGIIEGYGSWGDNDVIRETGIDFPDKGTVTFYHPDIAPFLAPTIFFVSGWGREADTYDKFFRFTASHGYSVINIYNTNPGSINSSYPNALDMITEVTYNNYSNWIDTTKVGIMGHSFGGGAAIWLGKEIFGDPYNWGENGRLIFTTTPWLTFLTDFDDLQNYPPNVKLLIEISDDDEHASNDFTWNTDERAIRAVYELINIPNDDKDFVRVYSDPATYTYNENTYSYDASHYISYTGVTDASFGLYRTFDAMDVYAINRLSHALTEYVFKGDIDAKNVALGNNSNLQTDMGFLTDLFVTDTPIITRPGNEFAYQCNSSTGWSTPDIWKLQNYCEDSNGDGLIDYFSSIKEIKETFFSVSPIPATSVINIKLNDNQKKIELIEIYNMQGEKCLILKKPKITSVDISSLEIGTYLVNVSTSNENCILKFIKQANSEK